MRWALTVAVLAALLVAPSRAQSLRLADARSGQAPAPAFDVMEKSIAQLQDAMASGKVTSRQLVEAYLARIAAYDKQGPALNAIVTLNPHAVEAADALDAERRSKGPRGPLHGIPVLVKDNYETVEMATAAGTIALASFHPKSDAFQVKKLRDGGAVLLGKTNMHELAAGITTTGSRFGQTRNPYDLDRNPGGSSGGTGAAIAANFAVAGMGSDTCGSIRQPASQNNLVGLRGTQGLSSRTGIVPLSATQDIGGPLARSIEDLAIVLDATVGPDPADAQTKEGAGHIAPSYRSALRRDALKGARIGVVRSLFGSAGEDQEVTNAIQRALDALKESGAEIVDVVIPGLDELLRDSSLISSEFKFDLADYLARHPDAPVKSLGEILERGYFHLALEDTFRARNAPEKRGTEQERRARLKRPLIRTAAVGAMDEHRLSVLVYPTLRRKPARLGDSQAGSNCTFSAHSGLPALAVPAAWSADGLPIGIDIVGRPWSESELLSLGYAMEQTWALRRPPFSTPALVNGKAPAPRTFVLPIEDNGERLGIVDFAYDPTTARLSYKTVFAPKRGERVAAIWVHRGTSEKPGAAVHQLTLDRSGAIVLSYADRAALATGQLFVRFYMARGASLDTGRLTL